MELEFLTENMQTIIGIIAVLVLIFVAMAVWRSLSPRFSGRRGQRLGISEYYEMDKTRRLVLVRRDNVEHLVLIGGPQDVVIESNISPAAAATGYTPSPVSGEPAAPRAPRPPVFGDRKPPPLRQAEPAPAASAPQPRQREEPEL